MVGIKLKLLVSVVKEMGDVLEFSKTTFLVALDFVKALIGGFAVEAAAGSVVSANLEIIKVFDER